MLKLIANKEALDRNFVLIVTTNTHERDAILKVVTKPVKLSTGNPGKRAYLGHIDNALVVVLDAAGGYADPNAATRFAQNFIRDPSNPRPALLLLSGVCWGNPTQIQVGEVIVCGTVVSANRWTAKPDEKDFKTYTIISTARTDELLADAPMPVRLGTLISQEVRLSDEATRDELLAKVPEALGGEMEAFALAPDCADIPWLVVKAVSDFGTFIEGREAQAVAASNAVGVVQHLMSRFAQINEGGADPEQRTLRDDLIHALHGRQLRILYTDLNPHDINGSVRVYLDRVTKSIAIHTNAITVDAGLARAAAKLTLEFASNAFKHGRARCVDLSYDVLGVSYVDDGTEFDVEELPSVESGRGGKGTYNSFSRRYLIDQGVSLAKRPYRKGNWLRIEISSDMPNLPGIIAACSARVDPVPMMPRQGTLRWDPACEVIYVDFDYIDMLSNILDLCQELVKPIAAGRKFIVLCSDPDTVAEVTKFYPDQVQDGSIRFIPQP